MATFPHPLRLPVRRRALWLLWAALVWSAAQVAGLSHADDHRTTAGAGHASGGAAVSLADCDLCLAAAAIGGGALPSAAPPVWAGAGRAPSPRAVPYLSWDAPLLTAFRSRAPPPFLR